MLQTGATLFVTSCVAIPVNKINELLTSCFSDFKCCPGNSPFCLGMTSFNCCGTQDLDYSEIDKDFECPPEKRRKLCLWLCQVLGLRILLCNTYLTLLLS